MSFNAAIGKQIKSLRRNKKITLQQLSIESGLSVGFLSQLERGLSSIAIDSLSKLAKILDVHLSTFFKDTDKSTQDPVVRGIDKQYTQISPNIYQFILSNSVQNFETLPRLFYLMPYDGVSKKRDIEVYNHKGEEFIYVLEGVLTVLLENRQHTLFPGDSMQIRSEENHNWLNKTGKIVKFLSINFPNPFCETKNGESEFYVDEDEHMSKEQSF